MDKLIEALADVGVSTENMENDEQIKKVAKAMGIDPIDYLDRNVVIEPYTNQKGETNMFVKTDPIVVGRKKNGMAETKKGLWVRVDALDQVLDDLLKARGMLQSDDE